MSAVLCYATYQAHNVTVELDLQSGRLTPQVWDDTLVPGYFNGQDYAWAENWFVHHHHVGVWVLIQCIFLLLRPDLDAQAYLDLALQVSYADAVLFKPLHSVNEISTANSTSPLLEPTLLNSTSLTQVVQDTYVSEMPFCHFLSLLKSWQCSC